MPYASDAMFIIKRIAPAAEQYHTGKELQSLGLRQI